MSRRLALVVSLLLLLNGAACGQARGRPAPLRGVLAPIVDSVLRAHPAVTCYHLPLATQTGDLEWNMNGCHVFAGDTLFYFYLGDDGRVWAWGHDWHVSDSTRATSLSAIAQAYAARFGPPVCAPMLERAESFQVWAAAGYFIYSFGDSEATALGLAQNIYLGARLGSPTCTFRDHVSPPFRR